MNPYLFVVVPERCQRSEGHASGNAYVVVLYKSHAQANTPQCVHASPSVLEQTDARAGCAHGSFGGVRNILPRILPTDVCVDGDIVIAVHDAVNVQQLRPKSQPVSQWQPVRYAGVERLRLSAQRGHGKCGDNIYAAYYSH